MAWRALLKMRRNPEQLVDVTVMPLLLTVLFGFMFGGAVAGGMVAYLPTLIPGIVAYGCGHRVRGGRDPAPRRHGARASSTGSARCPSRGSRPSRAR